MQIKRYGTRWHVRLTRPVILGDSLNATANIKQTVRKLERGAPVAQKRGWSAIQIDMPRAAKNATASVQSMKCVVDDRSRGRLADNRPSSSVVPSSGTLQAVRGEPVPARIAES
jgi:hypothetical protein